MEKSWKWISYAILTSLPLVLNFYHNRRIKSIKQGLQKDDSEYKFIIVTLNNFSCQNHIFKDIICGEKCSATYVKQLVEFFVSAKHTIMICMYLIKLVDLYDAVNESVKRGIEVKFITDPEMMACMRSEVSTWELNGVQVKTSMKDNSLMHHKFAIIDPDSDSNAKLLFGSLNLTMQGIVRNWDFSIITNNKKMIKEFHEEFVHLWDNF